MLFQLIQLAAILGAIALVPQLVRIEPTLEGDELLLWVQDTAPIVLQGARRLLRATATRLTPWFPGLLPTAPAISDNLVDPIVEPDREPEPLGYDFTLVSRRVSGPNPQSPP